MVRLFVFGVLLLGTLLMALHISHAKSAENNDLQESTELFIQFVDILHDNMLEGVTILRNILSDSNISQVHTESMKEKISEITNILKEVESFEDKEPVFDMYIYSIARFNAFRLVESTMLKYIEPEEELSSEDLLIQASLKKHGYDGMRSNLMQHFSEYSINMIAVVDRNIAKLSDEQKKDNDDQISTHNQMKYENDVTKKFQIFIDSLPEYGYNISEFH